jgi:hypothetical protein
MRCLVFVSSDTHMSMSRPERAQADANRATQAPNLPPTANSRPVPSDAVIPGRSNARLAVIWQERAPVRSSRHGAPVS